MGGLNELRDEAPHFGPMTRKLILDFVEVTLDYRASEGYEEYVEGETYFSLDTFFTYEEAEKFLGENIPAALLSVPKYWCGGIAPESLVMDVAYEVLEEEYLSLFYTDGTSNEQLEEVRDILLSYI